MVVDSGFSSTAGKDCEMYETYTGYSFTGAAGLTVAIKHWGFCRGLGLSKGITNLARNPKPETALNLVPLNMGTEGPKRCTRNPKPKAAKF